MNHYEIVLLVHPDHSEQVQTIIKHCSGIVKNTQGKVHRIEDWGRRQLAYPIAKVHKAHYALMNIECTLRALEQLEEFFRHSEIVLRQMILAVSEIRTEPSPVKLQEQEQEKDSRQETSSAG